MNKENRQVSSVIIAIRLAIRGIRAGGGILKTIG